MRKAVLIAVLLCVASCFLLYVMDFGLWGQPAAPEGVSPPNAQAEAESAEQTGLPPPAAAGEGGPSPSDRANPGGWTLVWADEFNGPYLDLAHWTEMERKDSYNNELQFYTPENSFVRDGCLVLTALRENMQGKAYTSAMVQTKEKFSFLYGRIEARMKLPVGKGIFPALWLMTDEGKNEVDIMERLGSSPETIYGVVHFNQDGRWYKQADKTAVENPDGFHEYAFCWEPDEMRWYVDGRQFFHAQRGVPAKDMYILITLAVGGDWPGAPDASTVFPCSVEVDYVRLYQREGQGDNQ